MSDNIRAEPSFALVIPTYNRAHLICETIESALTQKKLFTEIIVVDDGSTDNTVGVLAQFGDAITVIRTENKGVQSARNLGIRAAQSDYVTLCDSDDLLDADFLTVFSDWLSAHPGCDVLYSNFVSFNETTVFPDRFSCAPPGLYPHLTAEDDVLVEIPDLIEKIIQYQILFVTGLTLKRSVFDFIGGYDLAFNRVGAEDFEFTLRAVARTEVAFCKRPLARVRRHAGNDSIDQVRHFVGEINILEYALANHSGLDHYRLAIHAGLDERRQYVFDAAFAKGDFELAAAMRKKFRRLPGGVRFQIKNIILKLPLFCRDAFWRLSQA
jgi:glycosyltransferase involved in cell wall biosynthesis